MLVELDSNSEKLRQKEGWFHWVVTPEGTESSTDTGYSTSSAGTISSTPEYSTPARPGEVSPLLSAAPSEASETILVRFQQLVFSDEYPTVFDIWGVPDPVCLDCHDPP